MLRLCSALAPPLSRLFGCVRVRFLCVVRLSCHPLSHHRGKVLFLSRPMRLRLMVVEQGTASRWWELLGRVGIHWLLLLAFCSLQRNHSHTAAHPVSGRRLTRSPSAPPPSSGLLPKASPPPLCPPSTLPTVPHTPGPPSGPPQKLLNQDQTAGCHGDSSTVRLRNRSSSLTF